MRMDANPRPQIELLRTLRAVRRFSAEPLPTEALLDIVTVARWTGSAKNTQPWHVVITVDPDKLTRLAELGRYAAHLRGAKAAMVLAMDGPSCAFDAGRLAQNIMLAAWAHGIGSCIGSLYPDDNERQAKALLGIPAERWASVAISLGYPRDAQALRVASWPEGRTVLPSVGRKLLAEIASWETFGGELPSPVMSRVGKPG